MQISFKIDEDNDIYELTVNNEVYTLDNVYKSKYGELFDDLNIIIDSHL
jgi:hypothetical protein